MVESRLNPNGISVSDSIGSLRQWVAQHPRLFVLTGAGVSTGSGIPGYRDDAGQWQRRQPVTHQDFIASHATRQRYWSRSMLGYPMMRDAQPNRAHLALAALEVAGHVTQLVTQNVDGLHHLAGSARVTELHGSVHQVVCLGCGVQEARGSLQARMLDDNPAFAARRAAVAPDGDADVEAEDLAAFVVPVCDACGGMVKPDVVFYGAGVPRVRLDAAFDALAGADAVLVAGSSLMVYSGYRFCLRAQDLGKPIVAINQGRTRADALFALKVNQDCAPVLAALAEQLAPQRN